MRDRYTPTTRQKIVHEAFVGHELIPCAIGKLLWYECLYCWRKMMKERVKAYGKNK